MNAAIEKSIGFCSSLTQRGSVWSMVLDGNKRRLVESIGEGLENDQTGERQQEVGTVAIRSSLDFLELPPHIIFDILSRLPLESIFACRCVCKTFLELLDEPYFAEIHRDRAPITVNLVRQRCMSHWQCLSFNMLDLDQALRVASSSSSTDCHHGNCHTRNHPLNTLTKHNAEFCFLNDWRATLVGECNGLLCLYYGFSRKPVYCICNPILREYCFSPSAIPSTRGYTYFNHSSFGYCAKTGKYKVIRFTSRTSVDPLTSLAAREMVVEIHTFGSDSWRRIYSAPCPKLPGSFDPCLSGSLHWITDSNKPSELICSLDLERECFLFLPPPQHFSFGYVNKTTWINVGSLGGCLCLCYVYDDSQFEVWVMKDYGVKGSWTKEFSIDINLYTGLRAEDLHRPLKFLNNGDLWLHCRSNTLVSYSPRTASFKDFESLGIIKTGVIMHFPTFISLKHVLGGNKCKIGNFSIEKRPMGYML